MLSQSRPPKLLLLLLISLLVLSAQFVRKHAHAVTESSLALSTMPQVFLWAWERPENLDFIDPERFGVAFLAETISLGDDRVVVRPRLQPLRVPPNTRMVAVARIDSDRSRRPVLSGTQRISLVKEVAKLALLPHVVAIQVDFDATL